MLKLGLDMVKLYLFTQNEVPNYSFNRQTQTDPTEITITYADGNKHLSDISLIEP